MSVDLPMPIPTGRATSMVGAPNDVSAAGSDQGAVSGFDALMAALGPVTVPDDQTPDDTTLPAMPVQANPESPSDAAGPQPVATVVLPQILANLQSALPAPAADKDTAAIAVDDGKPTDADAAVAETPVQPLLAAGPVPLAQAMAVVPEPAPAAAPQEAPAPAPVRPAASKVRAATAGDVTASDADSDDREPVSSAGGPPAVVVQAPAQVQPQTPSPSFTPSRPDRLAASPAIPSAGQPETSDRTTDDAAAAPQAATPSAAAPSPAAPSPTTPAHLQPKFADAVSGSLKAARKALTDEVDTEGAAARPAPAPSGFSLQAQVEAPGAYTASGAQSAGVTQAGSNLARATVETLSNMAVQINRKLSEGNTKFAVELHPADLGKVEVTLSIARDGTTTAHLKFDTPVTAAAFQAHEGELRQQLAQTGLNLDTGSLTFSSRDDGNSNANGAGFNQAFAQMQQQNQPQGQQNRQSQARAFKNAQAVAADADASAAVDAGLLAQRMNVSSTLALNLIV